MPKSRRGHVSKIIKAPLQFVYELKLAPVDKSEARYGFTVVLLSTIVGSIVPLIPFFFATSATAAQGAVSSVILSGAVLFFIGAYEARTTVGSLWWSGLQMTIIGLAAGFAGYLIGHVIGAAPV
jgi:vacuolar iron transporter family protein